MIKGLFYFVFYFVALQITLDLKKLFLRFYMHFNMFTCKPQSFTYWVSGKIFRNLKGLPFHELAGAYF